MSDSIGIALLAAGKGTRMKVDGPKVLAPLLGRPILDYIIDSLTEFCTSNSLNSQIGVVLGHEKEVVQAHLGREFAKHNLNIAHQKEQKGTADALKSYFADTKGSWDNDYTMVVCGDTPLLTADIFQALYIDMKSNDSLVGVAATFKVDSPFGYGRIMREGSGFQIIEEKNANDDERKINEVNSGLYLIKTSFIKERLENIGNNNKQGEFLLTDLFQAEFNVKAICFEDSKPFLGINTLEQLEEAAVVLRKKKTKKLQYEGVNFIDSTSCYLDWKVQIAAGCTIYPNVVIEGDTTIGENSLIEMGVVIKSAQIGPGSSIFANSYIEEAQTKAGSKIGPMARLRPGADIGEDVKIGNFVEVKKSTLHKGAKVSHLSYIGDAEIGENSNVGCGFITCNYDGKNKHKTIIGKNSFIGSDCQAVAPVTIGDNTLVAAGSTITNDMPSESFAIARSRQVTKENRAKNFPAFNGKK